MCFLWSPGSGLSPWARHLQLETGGLDAGGFRLLSAERQRTALMADPSLIGSVTSVSRADDGSLRLVQHGPTGSEVAGLPATAPILCSFALWFSAMRSRALECNPGHPSVFSFVLNHAPSLLCDINQSLYPPPPQHHLCGLAIGRANIPPLQTHLGASTATQKVHAIPSVVSPGLLVPEHFLWLALHICALHTQTLLKHLWSAYSVIMTYVSWRRRIQSSSGGPCPTSSPDGLPR